MTDKKLISSLQGLRAVAFLSVVLSHCGAPWLGPWAISVFVALSGFLMTCNYYDRPRTAPGLRSAMTFSLQKIRKLYPLHLIMMAAALLLVLKGLLVQPSARGVLSCAAQLVVSIFLLQTWIPSSRFWFCLNGVAWYLSVQAFLYAIFPWLLAVVKKTDTRSLRCIAAAIFCAQFLFSFAIWKSVLHEKEQLVRERLLLGILHASVDVTALPQEYTKYGLVFPYRFFSLILIHMPALEIMEDFTKKEQLRLVVLSSASEAFSVLGKAYGIHTNGQNIGILLNTSIAEAELTAELKRLCSAISQRMQQTLSIDPFFSIVLCEQASPSYQKSWQLARRNLLFTSPETEDFMIIGHQEDLTSSLDPNLSIQLFEVDRKSVV